MTYPGQQPLRPAFIPYRTLAVFITLLSCGCCCLLLELLILLQAFICLCFIGLRSLARPAESLVPTFDQRLELEHHPSSSQTDIG